MNALFIAFLVAILVALIIVVVWADVNDQW
jgi:phosphotransferase system  glucose/maltose/N-acetylglucosamine-specific IIC component